MRVFNVVTEINESKPLTKHASCKCECKFDGRKYNSNQKWNNKYCCDYKNLEEHNECNNSLITWDKIIEETKTAPIKTVPITSTSRNLYILLAVLLITMTLIVFSIYLKFVLIIYIKMGNKFKEIDIKNRAYYFFVDIT